MKILKLTLFFLAICSFTIAQDSISVEKSYKYEIGLNVTSFVSQFLNFSGNQFNSGPYLFTFKNSIGESKYFRAGLGLNFRRILDDEDQINTPQFTSNSFLVNARLGLEKQIPISKRWLFTYGMDFPVSYSKTRSSSISQFENVFLINSNFSLGIGPVVGIHFNIGKRIRIGSEATFYVNYSRTNQKIEVNDLETDSDSFDNISGFLTSPTVLYLGIIL